MPERFTPEEIQELIASGDLTPETVGVLDPADQKVANHFIIGQAERFDSPLLPGGAKGIDMVAKLAGKVPGVGSMAKSAWNALGPAIGGTVGYHVAEKAGVPGYIGAIVGGQSMPRVSTRPAADPKPWGQRSAPVAGSKPLGPQPNGSSKASNRPSEPPNLIRQGNLTNPGPGGTGSPSVPSGKVFNPLTDGPTSGWSGPMGREDNWTTILAALSNLIQGSPLDTMDEADKRKIMFGGAGDQSRPQTRTPVGRRKAR